MRINKNHILKESPLDRKKISIISHIWTPKRFHKDIFKVVGKQVRIQIDDAFIVLAAVVSFCS
jgi:hypothetical protein